MATTSQKTTHSRAYDAALVCSGKGDLFDKIGRALASALSAAILYGQPFRVFVDALSQDSNLAGYVLDRVTGSGAAYRKSYEVKVRNAILYFLAATAPSVVLSEKIAQTAAIEAIKRVLNEGINLKNLVFTQDHDWWSQLRHDDSQIYVAGWLALAQPWLAQGFGIIFRGLFCYFQPDNKYFCVADATCPGVVGSIRAAAGAYYFKRRQEPYKPASIESYNSLANVTQLKRRKRASPKRSRGKPMRSSE